MIYTLTLNPAIDHYMIVDSSLINDEVNRASRDYCKAGGKGLNVSRTLAVMGIENTAIALLGGFTGDYIQHQFENHELIHFEAIRVNGNTRINSKIYAKDRTICVNGKGPDADEKAEQEVLQLVSRAKAGDYVMICGKACRGIQEDFIERLSDAVHHTGARLVIDMEDITLTMLSRCRPWLIKPNLYELSMILGKQITLDQLPAAADVLLQNGLASVLVSLGKDGSYYTDGIKSYRAEQPAFLAVNKVGCGDAMLAAFTGSISEEGNLKKAIAAGTAAGCAAAASTEDITAADIASFQQKISVR